MIHPTAIIHPGAQLDPSVNVGPYAVIDGNVTIGARCVIWPHVHLTGITTIGTDNHFHTGCVMGDAPQDLKYRDEPTRLRIGDHNVFREHVTVHRSTTAEGETLVGSHNFLMVNSHVGHNARLGSHIILANGALLAGHVTVGDRVFISGNCLVHQFVRLGTLALMQGGAAISMDLPPFTVATGANGICGLNVVGLRRAGIVATERRELKRLYHALFRGGQNLRAAVTAAEGEFLSEPARQMLEFIRASKRGVCPHTGASAATEEE